MDGLKIGDIVGRKSYGCDVFFKVCNINNSSKDRIYTLKGITYRIEADAPESDLIVQPRQKIEEYKRKMNRAVEIKTRELNKTYQANRLGGISKKFELRGTSAEETRKFGRSGKVLHLDGDADYLQTCLDQYKELGIDAVGKHVPEAEQQTKVTGLLSVYRPDILVLTGHDGIIKGDGDYSNVNNYRNSRYYIAAVKEARKFDCDIDSLVIFAGACQSMFNEIINAGANFASSPYRVLIHALDPVLVCHKIAFEGVGKMISPQEVVNTTITGMKGIGGLETRGKYRDRYPLEIFSPGKQVEI
jgi:spore coat assembly protein